MTRRRKPPSHRWPAQRPSQKKPPRAKTPEKHTEPEERQWWHKPIVWAGGVGTLVVAGVLAGVLVNVVTPPVQRIADPAEPNVTAAPPTLAPKATSPSLAPKATSPGTGTSTRLPLKVLSEDPLYLDQMVVWAFPDVYLPDRAQLNDISSLIESSTPAARSAFTDWFFSRGAYEVGGASTQLVVQNNRSYPIRIIDMNVVKSCGPPLTGTLFFGAGGAVDSTIGLGFNLDSSDTDAETARGTGSATWTPGYFDNYTISLDPGEQQVFDIYTVTTSHACAYRLQATVLDGSKKVYQLIGDGTEPFRVTAMPGSSGSDFSAYNAVFLGGAASSGNGAFVRVNPKDPFG